jgi:hypothetical protein
VIEAEPELLDAEVNDFRSLATALTGYTVSIDHDRISGLWLWRGDQPPLLVTSDSRGIVFKFEVFTLAIQPPSPVQRASEQQEAAKRAIDWPFSNWQVDVLWIRDWSIPSEAMPDGWYTSPEARRFGAVPLGADHTCLVAKALLFTGANGHRLIVDQGEMPLDLYVTTDSQLIDHGLSGAMPMPLDHYLAGAVPTIQDYMATYHNRSN